MTREERLAQIRPLLAEGLTHRQIADRLSLSASYVGHVLSDRAYESTLRSSREAKRRRTGTCATCGAATSYAGHGRGTSRYCLPCGTRRSGPQRRGRGPTVEAALAFLDQPRRYIELRDHLGITNGYAGLILHRLRKYGLITRLSRGVYQRTDTLQERQAA